jgi:DNA-binding NarL/FixJ family response regulator
MTAISTDGSHMPIRIAILDDCALFLEILASHFRGQSQFEVVGTAEDCETGIEIIAQQQPDLVMMEVELPGRGSFELAAHLQKLHPRLRLVFLTSCLADVFIDAALSLGFTGYLLKEERFSELTEHLQHIANGDRRFSPRVRSRLRRESRSTALRSRSAACLASLTHQQLEVLRHLARGDSVKEVSQKVDLSPRSIEGLKYRIMQQLGLHDRVALARFAIREGLTMP